MIQTIKDIEFDRMIALSMIMELADVRIGDMNGKKILCLDFVGFTDDRPLEAEGVFYAHSEVNVSFMADYTKEGWKSLHRQARVAMKESGDIWENIKR